MGMHKHPAARERKRAMCARAHERRKSRVEASQSAQDARATANRKAGKPVRVRTRREPLDRNRRAWPDAVAWATHDVGGKY